MTHEEEQFGWFEKLQLFLLVGGAVLWYILTYLVWTSLFNSNISDVEFIGYMIFSIIYLSFFLNKLFGDRT